MNLPQSRPADLQYAKDHNGDCGKRGCGHFWNEHLSGEPHKCGIAACLCTGFLPAYVLAKTEVKPAPGDDIPVGSFERFPNWLTCDNLHIACGHPMTLHRYMGSLSNPVGACMGLRSQGGAPCECKSFALSHEGAVMILCADCPHVEEFHVADALGAARQCQYRGCTCKAFHRQPAMEPGPAFETVLRDREQRGDISSSERENERQHLESTYARLPESQPESVHVEGGASMHDLAIEKLRERKDFGLTKYGTHLQVGNGRDWAKDVLDEAADWFVYVIGLVETAVSAINTESDHEDDLTMHMRQIEELTYARDYESTRNRSHEAETVRLQGRMRKLDEDHEKWQAENRRLREENEDKNALIDSLDKSNYRLRRISTLRAAESSGDRNSRVIRMLEDQGVDDLTSEEIGYIRSRRAATARSEEILRESEPDRLETDTKAQSDAENAQADEAAREHDRLQTIADAEASDHYIEHHSGERRCSAEGKAEGDA